MHSFGGHTEILIKLCEKPHCNKSKQKLKYCVSVTNHFIATLKQDTTMSHFKHTARFRFRFYVLKLKISMYK